jgi:hypothetical protein
VKMLHSDKKQVGGKSLLCNLEDLAKALESMLWESHHSLTVYSKPARSIKLRICNDVWQVHMQGNHTTSLCRELARDQNHDADSLNIPQDLPAKPETSHIVLKEVVECLVHNDTSQVRVEQGSLQSCKVTRNRSWMAQLHNMTSGCMTSSSHGRWSIQNMQSDPKQIEGSHSYTDTSTDCMMTKMRR